MDKNEYQKIIEEVSQKLSKEILSKEENLAQRATTIDGDIAGILKNIGMETWKKIIDETRDEIVKKKAGKD